MDALSELILIRTTRNIFGLTCVHNERTLDIRTRVNEIFNVKAFGNMIAIIIQPIVYIVIPSNPQGIIIQNNADTKKNKTYESK